MLQVSQSCDHGVQFEMMSAFFAWFQIVDWTQIEWRYIPSNSSINGRSNSRHCHLTAACVRVWPSFKWKAVALNILILSFHCNFKPRTWRLLIHRCIRNISLIQSLIDFFLQRRWSKNRILNKHIIKFLIYRQISLKFKTVGYWFVHHLIRRDWGMEWL